MLSIHFSVGAQPAEPSTPTSEYQLRRPTLEAYFAALPDIEALIELENTENSPLRPYQFVFTAIANEIDSRYTDADYKSLSLSTLQEADVHLVGPLFGYAGYLQSEVSWHRRVMSAWLREAQPDLSKQTEWQFGDYILDVQPADFDGDGIDDYAVELRYQLKQERDFDAFRGFFVFHSLAENPARYEIISDALPAFSINCFPQTGCGGDGKTSDILDVTGDGRPEWLIHSAQCGYGICGADLGIFQWQTDEMVDISGWAQEGIFMSVPAGNGVTLDPPQGGWRIDNRDDDASLEVNQHEELTDNLGCEFSRETIFDWVEPSGQFTQTQTVSYDDSLWCDLRQGHEAIKMLDANMSIQHYERFLKNDAEPSLEDVWTYVSLRLALAYGLAGDDEAAATLLQTLEGQQIQNVMIANMADAAQAAVRGASEATIGVRLCTALHQMQGEIDYFGSDMHQLFHYGHVNDYGMSMNYDMSFSVSSFGCNLSLLLENTLSNVASTQTFKALLEASGWEVIYPVERDLNQDGIDDEVLHIPSVTYNIVRLSTPGGFVHYTHYGPPLVTDNPDVTTDMTIFAQPDGHDALLTISYNETLQCEYPDGLAPVFPGSLRVWFLDRPGVYSLDAQIGEVLCQPQTIAETLPSSDIIVIHASANNEQIDYRWDEANDSYQKVMISKEQANSEYLSCLAEFISRCLDPKNPDAILDFVDFARNEVDTQPSPFALGGLAYYRAQALESLGRNDEALAEYVALSEGDPESPWHILAGLHLDRR